jgi:hypothetical protein
MKTLETNNRKARCLKNLFTQLLTRTRYEMKRVRLFTIFGVCLLFAATSIGLAGGDASPTRIRAISVDTLNLAQISKVSFEVVSGIFKLRKVTARIVEGEGYKVVSQPDKVVDSLTRGQSAVFTGAIQPLAKGTWELKVQGLTLSPTDTAVVQVRDHVYIHLSDTLNRVYSAYEYIMLPRGKAYKQKRSTPPDSIIYSPPGRQAKPAYRDSLMRKGPGRSKRSGSFNLIGSSYYHDPRDPSGWFRAEANTTVEVWNDNEYDSPSSPDVLLGTTVTDQNGCFSFWGLDNYDQDGTADPYLIWREENDSWLVSRLPPGAVYQWYSSTIWDVEDNSTVDFGDFYPTEGDPDEGAQWCFQYINLGWNTADYVGPHPGFVWCFWPIVGTYNFELNGSIYITPGDADAIDPVLHEYAHALMDQGYAGSVPVACDPPEQYINDAYCETFGWTEGWANFFPLVVTQDGVYDLDPIETQESHIDLEYPSDQGGLLDWQSGPGCPGRVAGALLDLWDSYNDGLDQNSANPVSFETIYTWGIQSHRDSTFCEFWSYLRENELSAQQVDLGIPSIENNTVYCCNTCGDANSDGMISITDAVFLINYVFTGAPVPQNCGFPQGKGDYNGDGIVSISDAIACINYVFLNTPCPHCQDMSCWTT